MKAWLKGGLIGAVIGIILLILIGGIGLYFWRLSSNCAGGPEGFWTYNIPGNPEYCQNSDLAILSFIIIAIIVLPVLNTGGMIIPLIILVFFVLGAIIGLIIGKIKPKNPKKLPYPLCYIQFSALKEN